MKLFHNSRSPSSRRVEATIHHLKAEVELIPVDIQAGEHRTPDFLRRNPNGMIPVLEDGGRHLWESGAIMQYLAKDQATFYPKATIQRALVDRWVQWNLAHFGRHVGTIVFERLFKPQLGLGAPDEELTARESDSLDRFALVLNEALSDVPFLTGTHPGLADFHIVGSLAYASMASVDFSKYTHLSVWLDRVEDLDAFRSLPALG